jgi:YD repeat-containing protein
MYLRQADYALPAVGPAVNFTRTYNSSSAEAGIFGHGWTSSYDEAIKVSGSTFVRWIRSDGQVTNFTRATSEEPFAPQEGDIQAQLLENALGFTLVFNDHGSHQFNGAGRLLSQADANGNTTTLSYDTNGFLAAVTDPFGRVITVVADSNGQIGALNDTSGTIATYAYGTDKLLLSVTYGDNSAFHFTYDGADRLTSVTDALGNLIEAHSYDSQGRAITSEKQGGVERYSLDYILDRQKNSSDD